MTNDASTCTVCGEYGRLHCADCDHTFCVEHLERHFAMGYFYLCLACSEKRLAKEAPAARKRRSTGKSPT